MPLRQQPQPQVLDDVRILVLVHQDVPEPPVIIRQDVVVGPQHLDHMQQQVAKIRRVELLQPGLVGRIQHPGLPAREIPLLRRRHPVRRDPAILPPLDHPHQRRRSPPLRVDVRGLHYLLQQPQLVVRVQDREAARQPHQRGMAPQHPRAQRMERPEPQPLRRAVQQGADTLPHLPRRLVRERHCQHLARRRLALQQDVREPRRQHPGLARARAGQHQHRAVHGLHGIPLLGVQAGEVFGHAGRMQRIPGV